MTSTVIIGGGLGGLATACRLAKAGHDVTVLEKNDTVGGRCNVFKKKGFTFDTGPTLLMMIDALHEFYNEMGTSLEKELPLIRIDPNYQIKFDDGKVLTYRTDRKAMCKELEEFEPGSSIRYEQYLRDACKDYNVAWKHFINRNYDGPKDLCRGMCPSTCSGR